jgi:hypothetical protein
MAADVGADDLVLTLVKLEAMLRGIKIMLKEIILSHHV